MPHPMPPSASDHVAQDPRPLSDESRSNFLRQRIECIAAKMNEYKLINRDQERRRIGNNLWRLLDGIEKGQRPVRKLDILHRANLGISEISTKRLHEYALNPGLPECKQKKRVKKLAKKIRRYADIARAAAELCNKDRDEFIPDLVEGTRYSLVPSELKLDRKGATQLAWKEIVGILSSATDGLTEKHELAGLFQGITAAGLDLSAFPREPDIATKHYASAQLLPRPALVDAYDLPSRPTVFLGGITTSSRIPCELKFQSFNVMNNEVMEPIYQQLVKQGLGAGSLRAYASAKLVVSLELLPHGKSGTVVPHLHLTPRVDFFAGEAFDGFAKAKFKTKLNIEKPDAIEIGDYIGCHWGPLPFDGWLFCDYRYDRLSSLAFAAVRDDLLSGDYIDLHVSATFEDDSLDRASYTKFTDAEEGALLVLLDDHAWRYLDYSIDISWKQPFCACVYDSGAQEKELRNLEKQPLVPLFTEGTMLAAIQRSIMCAPIGSGLHELLAKSAADFADRICVDLQKVTEKRNAEAELLQKGLDRLKDIQKQITRSYR